MPNRSPAPHSAQPDVVPVRLTELPARTPAKVSQLDGDPNLCARLREIGFCESAVIERISGERTLICQVCNTRIALSDKAAKHILVERLQGGC